MDTREMVATIKHLNRLGEQMIQRLEGDEKNLIEKRETIMGDESEYLYFKYLDEVREQKEFLFDAGFLLRTVEGVGLSERTAEFLEKSMWENYKLLSRKHDEILHYGRRKFGKGVSE